MSPEYWHYLLSRFLETMVPVVAVGAGVWVVSLSPLGRAMASRLHVMRPTEADAGSLANDLAQIQRQLGEVQERLDFAERLLASPKAPREASGNQPVVTPT